MTALINKDPKNIIVRMPNWVGDLVMATPVISDIKRVFPYCHLTVLAQENVCDLLKKDRDIDLLFCLKKQKLIFFLDQKNKDLIQELKKINYDCGILLTNSFSSAYFFSKAGIKNVIGYKNDCRSIFIRHLLKPLKNVHQIVKYKNLLTPLGIEISDTKPKIVLELNEIEKTKDILYQKGYNDNRTLIGINPSAKYGSAKCWPLNRFKEVCAKLAQDKKNFIVFVGDKDSKAAIDEICKELPSNAVNLAGATSLRELGAIIQLCRFFLTNDSGPMHIASALNVPLIALFGSTSEILTGPYNDKTIVINKKVKCSPCFKRICTKDFKCMNQITVDEVLKKIKELIDEDY